MRISVCEYLRITTHKNWCYVNPGHWMAHDGVTECVRVDEARFEIRKKGRRLMDLKYFAGLPSNIVRADLKRTLKKKRKTA